MDRCHVSRFEGLALVEQHSMAFSTLVSLSLEISEPKIFKMVNLIVEKAIAQPMETVLVSLLSLF